MATEVWAIAMVKDEADVIEHTVRRMLRQVDHVLMSDNGSTDGTREILRRISHELPLSTLTIYSDPDPAYYQSRKMTTLAECAAAAGAKWVVPFDADEVWLPRDDRPIREILRDLPGNVLVAEAPLFDHVATARDPDDVVDPVARMGWRRPAPGPLRKVACRAVPGLTIHQGNHGATFDGVPHPPAVTTALEVRHFPYRSVEQFVSKVRNGAAAYAATDLPEEMGGHWRGYGRILDEHGEAGIAEIFHRWFWRAEPDKSLRIDDERQPPLEYDPCP